MKFPGKRKKKHYFPTEQRKRDSLDQSVPEAGDVYIVGIDQLLVDIEIKVTDAFLKENHFPKGESFLIDDSQANKIYETFSANGRISGVYPGGCIGNTLHNYCLLSDGHAVAFGAIKKNIEVGDYAFEYLVKTSSLLDLSYLHAADGHMGRAFCFVSEDAERTFAIIKGCMDSLPVDCIKESVIKDACALVMSTYTLRDRSAPIYQSCLKACELAQKHHVPVVLTLGTSGLVGELQAFLKSFIRDYVQVVAMNQFECQALTGISDPLLGCENLLEICDLAMVTVGEKGLYIGGYVDSALARPTSNELHSKSIMEYNRWEFSRPMRKTDCRNPIKIYSHINPFMGGPLVLKNTNGAGDAALAAILHDMAANVYHKKTLPNSPKHKAPFITYSSLSQLCKYANRVSYEVLSQYSPRLLRGLPIREESLEDIYWES